MSTARSKSLIATVILLVLLALASGASLAVNQFGAARIRQGGPGGAFATPGPGTPAPGDNSQGNPGPGTGRNGGNFPGRGGGGFFGLAGIFRNLGIDFQLMGYINLAIAGLGILLLLVSALGVWMQKRWGLYLAIVVAILFLLGAVPGLLFGGGRFSLMRTGLDLLSAALAVGVIFLSFLPSTRSAIS